MNNQDNITQLYQDAFKDFAVEAPATIQNRALAQVGRKSLLTLDPTRLNVFYLALMSGIVAWTISSATVEDAMVKSAYETRDSSSSILLSSNSSEMLEDVETVNFAISESEVQSAPQILNQNPDVTAQLSYSAAANETQIQEQNFEQPTNDLSKLDIKNSFLACKDLEKNAIPALAQEKLDIRSYKAITGAKAQDADDVMKAVKLDRDGEVNLKVYLPSKK